MGERLHGAELMAGEGVTLANANPLPWGNLNLGKYQAPEEVLPEYTDDSTEPKGPGHGWQPKTVNNPDGEVPGIPLTGN